MPHPSLFDSAPDADPPEPGASDAAVSAAGEASAAPDASPGKGEGRDGPSALEHLIGRLERSAETSGHRLVHPRGDKMWLTRDGATYTLALNRGRSSYPLTGDGIRQLAGLLDVPKKLLDRLSALPNAKLEDCRLLNMLLWAEGGREEARFRLHIRDGAISAVRSGRYTPLANLLLARRLASLQQDENVRVRWYDLDGDELRLEILHTGRDPLDLSPDLPGDREATPDLWQPGAVLINREDGSRALTIVPALFRRWGETTLPVLPSKDALVKHRHAGHSEEELLELVARDLPHTVNAPYAQAGARLKAGHTQLIPEGRVLSYVTSLDLPFPTKGMRDDVVARVTTGRPSVYRTVTAILVRAKDHDRIADRHRLEVATGRYVWTRELPAGD